MRDVTLKEIREINKEKVIGEFFYQEGKIEYKSLVDENIKKGLFVISDLEMKNEMYAFYLEKTNLNGVIKAIKEGKEWFKTYYRVHLEMKNFYGEVPNQKLILSKIELDNLKEGMIISSNGIKWRKEKITIKKEKMEKPKL